MNVYKWTVIIGGNEGALMDNLNEARDHAREHNGVLREYEFEYVDYQDIEDFSEGGE